MRAALSIAAALLAVAGCWVEPNYLDPDGPRFSGDHTDGRAESGEVFRIVSYNLAFGREIERAITALSSPPLAGADVILMQEMGADGVDQIAAALSLRYVYYPASVKKGGDWGNAVLTRWPITGDHKLLLPHADPYSGSRRIAVACSIEAGGELLVYSTHTGTMTLGLGARLDQIETIAADADADVAVIGGDLNTADWGSAEQTLEVLAEYGFSWISEEATDTASGWGALVTLDYVFGRGLESVASGTFTGDSGSDHQPIWVELPPR